MRRFATLLALAGFVTAGAVCVAPAGAATATSTLRSGHQLSAGKPLVSANRRFRAAVRTSDGRLIVVRSSGAAIWHSAATVRGAHLSVGKHGQLAVVRTGHAKRWVANTKYSGSDEVLTLRNDGALVLTAGHALVWSSKIGNGCHAAQGKTFRVDISRQLAWMCNGSQQLRYTSVTTGASAHRDGTPTGHWRVQGRYRHATLRPSSGGAYHVNYWVPYHGAYGIHDSSWQHFPYGSSLYRTRGSHGCVHVPGASMTWLFHWLRVGSIVSIHR